ncbi:helix-turn-helix domain-containing protein [Faecalimonas sp.]
MCLGEKLIKYRRECGLSQKEVAEKMNVTRQMVSCWERDLTIPDIQILQQLANIYGVDIEEILQEESSAVKNEEIVALICGIILAAAFQIPIINSIVPLFVLLKFKNRKYSAYIRAAAIVCLVIGLYNTYGIFYTCFNPNSTIKNKHLW